MIENHIIFFLYTIIFIQSTIGYGYIFSKIIGKEVLQNNLGYIGLFGFFFISLTSIFTSFFFAHNYLHNIILHFVGLIASLFFLIHLRGYFDLLVKDSKSCAYQYLCIFPAT